MPYLYAIMGIAATVLVARLTRRWWGFWVGALALALAACGEPCPSGTGGEGSTTTRTSPDAGADAPTHPQCYYNDDCDAGTCVDGACQANPLGHCTTSSQCPPPAGADTSCTSTYCDTAADICVTHNSQSATPCGAIGMACDGMGHCVFP